MNENWKTDGVRMVIPIVAIREKNDTIKILSLESVVWLKEKSDCTTVDVPLASSYNQSVPIVYRSGGEDKITNNYHIEWISLPEKLNHLPTIRNINNLYGKKVAMFLTKTEKLVKDKYYFDVATLSSSQLVEIITEVDCCFAVGHPLRFLDRHLATIGVYRFSVDILAYYLERYGYKNDYNLEHEWNFIDGRLDGIKDFIEQAFGKRLRKLIGVLFDRDYICKVKGM